MRVLAAVVLLAGCNAVLGIDDTRALQHPSCEGGASSLDEDGDGVPNGVDNCPGQYNPTQLDRDGDGVGDACDVHPDTPGDRFVDTAYFERDLACWVPDQIASWQLGDGRVTTPRKTSAILGLVTSETHPTVELGVAVADFDDTTSYLEITFDYPNGSASCTLLYRHQTPLLIVQTGADIYIQVADFGTSPHRLVFSRSELGDSCSLDGASVVLAEASVVAPVNIGVRIVNGTLALDYAIVYGVTP